MGGMRTEWGEPDVTPNENSVIDKRDNDLFDSMRDSETPSYLVLLSEENLYELELAPVIAMKISAEQLKAAMRRKREEAGEEIKPSKRTRGRERAEMTQAPEASRDVPPPAEMAGAKASRGGGRAVTITALLTAAIEAGPSRIAAEEMPETAAAPCQTEAAAKEGELLVPPIEAVEEAPTTVGVIVLVSDPEDRAPTVANPAEARRVEEDGPPAPAEPEVEGAPRVVEEGEAVPAAPEDRAEPTTVERAGEETPVARLATPGATGAGEAGTTTSHPRRRHHRSRQGREESSAMPKRPVLRATTMEDAARAERLLNEVQRTDMLEEFAPRVDQIIDFDD